MIRAISLPTLYLVALLTVWYAIGVMTLATCMRATAEALRLVQPPSAVAADVPVDATVWEFLARQAGLPPRSGHGARGLTFGDEVLRLVREAALEHGIGLALALVRR